ncbi:MAG: adenosylmethionine decarboxylase [Ktedonobacterales bacterium]
MFGPHLIIDGTRSDTKKLADRILVEQVMNDYPTAIGMTKIGGPYMFEYQAPDPAYSGVSGIVVIAESHIAIHTFPELDYFTMDIFSCKNFDHEVAIEYIRKAFDVKEMDRMLVQRGLSFRGPHHGKLGATDELIAAAEARLAAGIVSKEPALPDAPFAGAGLDGARETALARRADVSAETAQSAGKMVWPQYGVTPDYGSYSSGAMITPLHEATRDAPVAKDGSVLRASEPVQVNPTASISGLLDKMCHAGGAGRTLGRSLAVWESLARDSDATIALALSSPVVAEGMRELLVYAIEHRYVDVLVASADDLMADLYEALGYTHFVGEDGPVMTNEGRDRTETFLVEFLDGLESGTVTMGADLLRRLGESLPEKAPRKGVLQAAAAAGVRVVVPDLSTSAFGNALLTARAHGKALTLDTTEDVLALAQALAATPRFGVVRVGEGAADALVMRARDVAPALGLGVTTLAGSVTLGGTRGMASGEQHVVVVTDATMTLPLVLTGLAQRMPGNRRAATPAVTVERVAGPRAEEPAAV